MFDRIVLRRSETGDVISLGDLAEALLFYQHVHLILDHGTLSGLAHTLGIPQLISLLKSGRVSAVYCRETLGTKTDKLGALEHHSFVAFELAGHQDSSKRFKPRDAIEDVIRRGANCSHREASKLTDQLLELVPIKSLAGGDFLGSKTTSLIDAATADVFDTDFISKAFSQMLSSWSDLSKYASSISVETYQNPAGFLLFSNLDLKSINAERSRQVPPQDPITIAHLLTDILSARSDISIAAHYGSDYKTSNTGSSLLTLRHDELLRRSDINDREKNHFQQIVVNEGRSLKEVINSGERSFDEFLSLLDKSKTFKKWTSDIHPDASMVAEYLKEASREGWIGTLPSKGLRFVIGEILGSVPGVGTAYSLADTFLVERLSKGWRANHFVERRLKPFINR